MLRRVVVIASESEVATPDELFGARRLGQMLAQNGIVAVTGGSPLGPAGALTDAALEAGGQVVGVVLIETPEDRIHPSLSERKAADDQAAREREYGSLGDAVVGLGQGFSSLADAFASWTWTVDGRPQIPLGLIDQTGYYSNLLKQAPDSDVDQFVKESQRGLLVMSNRIEDILRRLADYRPPETRRNQGPDDEFDDPDFE